MTFNLRKQALQPMGDLILPDPGIEPDFGMDQPMVNLEWDNGGQNMYTNQREMVDALGGVEVMREKYMGIKQNPNNSRELADDVEQINSLGSKKPFNLKKAQGIGDPYDPIGLNDSPELVGDNLEVQQNVEPTKTYETHSDLNNMLIEVANAPNAFQTSWNNILKENPQEADSAQAALKSYFQGFETKGAEQHLKDAEIIHELIYGKEDIMPINAEYKALGASVNETSKIIKKIAHKTVNKNKKKAYNLTKTAQHKTLDNAILYGPGETRIDPFLHQPVSDWHIVERNKGFGLVVDDIWNIDYETIWRENVMDKYSRPYKNKEGKWVGGYLNKRFEIDSNVPETSNMQLKPGQLRRPILPEYGNTESRLQAARAKGDIAGAIDTSKPFNWKEASSKKKKLADLKPLRDLPEMKPLKLPGEKDPTQAICTCPYCNSCVDQKTHECQNCHQIIVPNMGQPHPRKVPQRGERYDDYGPKLDYIIQAGSGRGKKKDKDLAEHSEDTVKDEFSADIDMCIDPFDKKRRNVDISKEEVMRSCEDLAIDG